MRKMRDKSSAVVRYVLELRKAGESKIKIASVSSRKQRTTAKRRASEPADAAQPRSRASRSPRNTGRPNATQKTGATSGRLAARSRSPR